METEFYKKPFVLIGPGLIGAVFVLAIFYSGSSNQPLIRTPEYTIWMGINLITFVALAIFLGVWSAWFHKNRSALRGNWVEIAVSILLITIFYVIPLIIWSINEKDIELPLPYENARVVALISLGYLISTVPVCISIWTLHDAINQMARDPQPTQQNIEKYLQYRDELNQFLSVEGVFLSLNIFTGAAQRQVLLLHTSLTAAQYPQSLILLNGAINSVVISMIFFPTYWRLQRLGRKMVNAFVRLPAPGAPDWDQLYQKRKMLEGYLELDLNPQRRFLSALTFAAPLISSILSLLSKQ